MSASSYKPQVASAVIIANMIGTGGLYLVGLKRIPIEFGGLTQLLTGITIQSAKFPMTDSIQSDS